MDILSDAMWRRTKYLDRCLSSLVVDDEKMAQLEVIVVNDGSKVMWTPRPFQMTLTTIPSTL